MNDFKKFKVEKEITNKLNFKIFSIDQFNFMIT